MASQIPKTAEGLDSWLLEQWTFADVEVKERKTKEQMPVTVDRAPVSPPSKAYKVFDYVSQDSKGRISKKRAMETLELLSDYGQKYSS